ncbi:MAG TPA: YqaA family protein [Methylophilaceae bacterium]|nr:YqaA family protein [Methylophilaceae bacterium]
MAFLTELGYIGLFIASFLAATILPISSELVLGALLVNGLPMVSLIVIATVGNVLGSLLNYSLGYWASLGVVKKWLKLSEVQFLKAERRFKKYGILSLLFAWVPIIGDPITLVAGILRIPMIWFVILVTIGKLMRYMVISYFVLHSAV